MAQHPLKALLLKPAANAGWKWERLEVASCIAALCWNKSVEQRSASYVSQELAQTAATGLHCSPTGQGKKGLKGLCISGHYVSAHAAHVNLLHFLTLLHSAFHLGSPRPSGHKWSVFVYFFSLFLCKLYSSFSKSGSSVATKSWRDVENPLMMMQSAHQGLELLSPAPSVRLDMGLLRRQLIRLIWIWRTFLAVIGACKFPDDEKWSCDKKCFVSYKLSFLSGGWHPQGCPNHLYHFSNFPLFFYAHFCFTILIPFYIPLANWCGHRTWRRCQGPLWHHKWQVSSTVFNTENIW